MLYLDPYYDTYRILAIDPGLTNLGVAAFLVNSRTEQILKIETQTIVSEKLPNTHGLDELDHGSRLLRLYSLEAALFQCMETAQPGMIVCESPFFDPRKPAAFSALVEVMYTIHNAMLAYDRSLQLTKIAPQAVKKSLGVAGIRIPGVKGKDIVKDALLKHPELTPFLPINLEGMTEHEIDAVCVGYTAILERRSFLPF